MTEARAELLILPTSLGRVESPVEHHIIIENSKDKLLENQPGLLEGIKSVECLVAHFKHMLCIA